MLFHQFFSSKQSSSEKKKTRFRLQPTKKVGCLETMKITKLKCYPEHTVTTSKNIREVQAKMLANLKNILQRKEDVLVENWFYITVSKPSGHSHSSWTCFLNQELDERLKTEIERCVSEGVTDIRTIQVLLKRYVKTSVSDNVPLASRSFYPKRKIIYNYVLKFMYESRASKIYQVALIQRVHHWENTVGGKFFYSTYEEGKSTFMFCYQSKWQEYLLQRYGAVVFLDATYETTKYPLPLFFLVVKTNIGYIVVGTFVIQYEDAASIARTLEVFTAWNESWIPEYFVIDFSEAEMNSIGHVFRCPTYICDFHREQS